MASKAKRSFGLSAEDVQKLSAEYAKTKQFPNPYRAGAYGFTIDGLVALGANKPHPLAKVHAAFKKAAGREWYTAWAGSEKRNEETGLDSDGRFAQNLRVLQRTGDYSLKLLQAGREVLKSKGVVIDMTRDAKGALFVCLNTDSNSPIKPGRSTVAAKVAREGSVSRQDSTGGKTKAKGAAKRKTPQDAPRTPRTAKEAK